MLKRHLPKLDKLAPRAHIGYLVSYESTNIFNIWVPSEGKIYSSRDIIFNETKFYNPNDPDLALLLSTTTPELIQVLDYGSKEEIAEEEPTAV